MAEREDDIIRLATARNAMEAHIWRQALETEGLRCEVVGEFLSHESYGEPASELWVHRRDADLARAILQVYRDAAEGVVDEDEVEDEDMSEEEA